METPEISETPSPGASWGPSPAVAAAVVLIALGLLMRIAYLSERPMHHDESIHATLSYQWWEAPDRSFYKYDPTYHGPFLYSVVRWLFPLFGTGPAQARLFPLCFGIAVLFTPLLFRAFFGVAAAWLSILILAVSPLFVYYARFLAHDMPSIFFAVLGAAFLVRFYRARQLGDEEGTRAWLCEAAVALGLLFSVKAVGFLYVFIYTTFVFFNWAYERFPRVFPRSNDEERARLGHLLKSASLAASLFFASYAVIQTSFFSNADGFLDGLYRRVIPYWWGQHEMERVVGPVTYHLRSLLLHELPLTLLLGATLGRRLWRWRVGRIALLMLGAIALATVPSPWPIRETLGDSMAKLLGVLKMRVSPDIFLFSMCFVFGILGGYQYLEEKRRFRAFLVYWSFASLAIYSYVGEKAPWLTPHVVFPMALLAGAFLSDVWEAVRAADAAIWKKQLAMATAALAIFWQVRIAYLVTFITDGEPTDLLSQVHNTRDVRFVMDWMKRVSLETGERTEGIPIAIVGQPVWAYYFHLIEYGFKRFALDTNSLDGTQRFVILDEAASKEVGARLLDQGYRLTKLQHSGWWVPEHGNVSWADWAGYAITRKPPTSVGLTWMWVYYKPLDTEPMRSTAAGSKEGAKNGVPPVSRPSRAP